MNWEMNWWTWLLLGIFLLVVEILTPGGFYMLFFGVAAAVVGLILLLFPGFPALWQWLAFTIIAILALLLFRRPLLAKLRGSRPGGELDTLVGETALATADMAPDEIGSAELRGTSWTARNVGPGVVTIGQRCLVDRVDGLILCIRGT